LDGQDKLKIRMPLPGAAERLGAAQSLLRTLAAKP
jgi:transcription-repair coupling factor (superfamily II helicase)